MYHRRVLAVHVIQRIEQLIRPVQYLLLVKKLVLALRLTQNLVQVAAFDKIHDEILAAVVGEVVRHLGQVGMIEPGQGAGLDAKLLGKLRQIFLVRRFGEGGQHLLDGADAARQAHVAGLVNGPHPSLAHQFQNFVTAAQQRARL